MPNIIDVETLVLTKATVNKRRLDVSNRNKVQK